VQDTNNVHGVVLQGVINPNCFKSSNWPRAKILNPRIVGGISRAHMRILTQGLNGALDGIAETNGDLGSIRREEVIPELTYDVVAGGLSILNLHERWPVLCSASNASVRLPTERQNSSSASCFEASPSASKVSSSSGVPVKPGTVRCSTAVSVKAASTLPQRTCKHRG